MTALPRVYTGMIRTTSIARVWDALTRAGIESEVGRVALVHEPHLMGRLNLKPSSYEAVISELARRCYITTLIPRTRDGYAVYLIDLPFRLREARHAG